MPEETNETVKLSPEDQKAADLVKENATPKDKIEDAKLDAKDAQSQEQPKPEPVQRPQLYGPGPVTCKSTSFETDEPISARIVLPEPVAEDKLFYAFKQHHPSARREGFEIDTENATPSDLKTNKE